MCHERDALNRRLIMQPVGHPADGGWSMERCHNCWQDLMEIDNRGNRLTGCLTCNLWAAVEGDRWVRLSEDDLRALHQLLHGGFR